MNISGEVLYRVGAAFLVMAGIMAALLLCLGLLCLRRLKHKLDAEYGQRSEHGKSEQKK